MDGRSDWPNVEVQMSTEFCSPCTQFTIATDIEAGVLLRTSAGGAAAAPRAAAADCLILCGSPNQALGRGLLLSFVPRWARSRFRRRSAAAPSPRPLCRCGFPPPAAWRPAWSGPTAAAAARRANLPALPILVLVLCACLWGEGRVPLPLPL